MKSDPQAAPSEDPLPPLGRPLEALARLTETRATLDRLERLLVREARLEWSTWHEIGASLGISRQAAHRRHRLLSTRWAVSAPVSASVSDTARLLDGSDAVNENEPSLRR